MAERDVKSGMRDEGNYVFPTETTHVVVDSTVYATFVILTGSVHSTAGLHSIYLS